MRFLRTVLALLIAWSLVALPGARPALAMTNAVAHDASKLAVTDKAMSSDMAAGMGECCPDDEKARPCSGLGECPLASCTAQPASIGFAPSFRVNAPLAIGDPLPIPLDQILSLHSGTPPFRPPRV